MPEKEKQEDDGWCWIKVTVEVVRQAWGCNRKGTYWGKEGFLSLCAANVASRRGVYTQNDSRRGPHSPLCTISPFWGMDHTRRP